MDQHGQVVLAGLLPASEHPGRAEFRECHERGRTMPRIARAGIHLKCVASDLGSLPRVEAKHMAQCEQGHLFGEIIDEIAESPRRELVDQAPDVGGDAFFNRMGCRGIESLIAASGVVS